MAKKTTIGKVRRSFQWEVHVLVDYGGNDHTAQRIEVREFHQRRDASGAIVSNPMARGIYLTSDEARTLAKLLQKAAEVSCVLSSKAVGSGLER